MRDPGVVPAGLDLLQHYSRETVVRRALARVSSHAELNGLLATVASLIVLVTGLFVDWQVRTGNAPGAQKQWVKMQVLLEQPGAPTSVTLGTNTEIVGTRTSGPFTTDGLPYVLTYIPEEHGRSQTLTCGVSGGEVGKRLAIQGLTVDYNVAGTNLR